jgi:hypothetical protein
MDVSLEKVYIHKEIASIEEGVWINSNLFPVNGTFSNCDRFTSGSNSTEVSDCHLYKEHS